jgi:gamma-glutamyltranspeptidase/glutathione hydrolase
MQRLKPFSEITFIFYRPDGTPIPLPVSHDTSIAPDAERLVQTDLAHTMRLIAAGGRDVFYRGEIGCALAQHVSAHGGIVTEQDMAEYEVRVREPMIVPYRDKRVEFIPVNSGGPTVAEMLNILEGFDLGALGHNTPQTLHLMAEAQRMAFADRFAFLGDPAFSPIPLEGLLSKAYAAERRRHIDPDHGPVPQPVGNPWDYQAGGRPPSVPPASGGDFADQHTTHLSVIDRSRNMVSLTASLGQRFGSGVVVPGTGVILNNGMMWFDPEPGRINSIVPGKHALHAGTPALVFDDKGPQMALGAPGGRMVLTSVLQVMLNVLDFGLGMQAAITAPRIHCETGSLWVDPRLPAEVIEGLRRIRDDVVLRAETRLVSSYYGRPNGISIDRVEGVLRGGVEPFKVSTAVGF